MASKKKNEEESVDFDRREIVVMGTRAVADTSAHRIVDRATEGDEVSSQYSHWGAVNAAALKEHALVDANYRRWRAEKTLQICSSEKVSQWKLKAMIEADPKFLEWKGVLAQALENATIAHKEMVAFSLKKDMLQTKSANVRKELDSDSSGLSRVVRDTAPVVAEDEDEEDEDEEDDFPPSMGGRGLPRSASSNDDEDEDEEDEEEEEEKPPPKRRGRPPKAVAKDDDEDEDDEEEEKPPPKRRGRPPKVAKAASDDDAPPKRRGRPPKSAKADDEDDDEEEKSAAPKRRGRPPKSAKADESERRHGPSDDDDDEAPAPKRRGRPPKKVRARVVETDEEFERRLGLSDDDDDDDDDPPMPRRMADEEDDE